MRPTSREHAEELHHAGWAEVEKQNYHRATVLWRESIQTDPSFTKSYRDLAYYYLLMQEYPGAEETARAHIDVDPEEGEPRLFRALALIHLGRGIEANEEFRRAIALLPDSDSDRRREWEGYWQDHIRLSKSRVRFARFQALFGGRSPVGKLLRLVLFLIQLALLRLYSPLVRSRFVPLFCLNERRRFGIGRYLTHRRRNLPASDFRMMYARVAETVLCSETIGPAPGKSVVDVGSGTNSLPLYWASRGMKVTLSDPDDFVLGLKPLAERMGLGPRIEKGDLVFEVADGANLPFPANTFDFWTSISVVEHIPGEGDSAVMREACRVLKPGGIAVVTTEGGTNPHERWIPVGGYFGKQYEEGAQEGGAKNREEWERMAREGSFALLREYDYVRLKQRLIDPSGMELIEAGFIDSKFETNFRELIDSEKPHWEGKILREWTPLICFWSYRRVANPETHRPRPGATAYAILRKPIT